MADTIKVVPVKEIMKKLGHEVTENFSLGRGANAGEQPVPLS